MKIKCNFHKAKGFNVFNLFCAKGIVIFPFNRRPFDENCCERVNSLKPLKSEHYEAHFRGTLL